MCAAIKKARIPSQAQFSILGFENYTLFEKGHPLPNTPRKKNGNAFIKIGYMLQELGVLPPKVDEMGRQIETLFASFDEQELKWIGPFFKALEKSNRALSTLRNYLMTLRDFNIWLQEKGALLSVNHILIERYLDSLFENGFKLKYVRDTRGCLNKIYDWCCLERLILSNPCEKVKVQREPLGLRTRPRITSQ